MVIITYKIELMAILLSSIKTIEQKLFIKIKNLKNIFLLYASLFLSITLRHLSRHLDTYK